MACGGKAAAFRAALARPLPMTEVPSAVMFWRRTIPTARLGPLGERRAAWFYRLRGYTIVARNVRFRRGEIDLIVRRGRTLAFVEVKTRQSLTAGAGYDGSPSTNS